MALFDSVKEDGNSYIIRNFPLPHFAKRLEKEYKSKRLSKLLESVGFKIFKFFKSSSDTVKIHKFFIPELIYLLRKFNYPDKLINKIIDSTWIKSIEINKPINRIDIYNIKKEMNVTLRDFQQEFIEEYDIKKQKYLLNGYLLSFDQGLGKTLTSLALMTALKKQTTLIIAPKSTLQTVWEHHILTFYKNKKKVVLINRDPIVSDADFIIMNYEAMDKIESILPELSRNSEDVGIIVDESHNFLRQQSNRTVKLIKLRQSLNCKDILLMSGTPIKALGLEVIPLLMTLDPFFDDEAIAIYKTAFGVNTAIATDVLRTRMNIMMHRKVKEEVLKLPKKYEELLKIKLPYGTDYTVTSVQKAVKEFTQERFEYYKINMKKYTDEFFEVIQWLEDYGVSDINRFKSYLKDISYLRSHPVTMQSEKDRETVKRANEYENNVLFPELPDNLKKQFKRSKSVVKYVHLKIRGEVIGQLLTRLRIKMTKEMIEGCKLEELVKTGIKKTVIFTSYTDVIEEAARYLEAKGMKPVLVYGKTASDTKKIVDQFKNDPDTNPIIASLLSMSTGVTLIEADTMVFLNKPWRHVDYAQASDRIHRIGQDTDVTIYSLVLDTGDEDNLSTRMEFINDWSKQQFDSIVGTVSES